MGKASRMKQQNRHSGRVKKHGGNPHAGVPPQAGNLNDFLSSREPGAYTMTSTEVEDFVIDQTMEALLNDDLAAFTQSVQLAEFAGLNIVDFNYSIVSGKGTEVTENIFATAFLTKAVNVLTWLCYDYINQHQTRDIADAFLPFTGWLFDKVDLLDKESRMFKLVESIVADSIHVYERIGVLDLTLQTFPSPVGPVVSGMISKEKARTLANTERESFEAEIQMPPTQAEGTKHSTGRI